MCAVSAVRNTSLSPLLDGVEPRDEVGEAGLAVDNEGAAAGRDHVVDDPDLALGRPLAGPLGLDDEEVSVVATEVVDGRLTKSARHRHVIPKRRHPCLQHRPYLSLDLALRGHFLI